MSYLQKRLIIPERQSYKRFYCIIREEVQDAYRLQHVYIP